MNLDERISLAAKLIAERKDIDQKLNALFGGGAFPKKQLHCSRCGLEGHNAKTCPDTLAEKNEHTK